MKKILLAVDSCQPSWPALDFACYLGKLTRSPVTGIFLHNLIHRGAGPASDGYTLTQGVPYETNDHARRFAEACCLREVPVRLHRDNGDPANALISETKMADILVVDPELSFNKRIEGSITTFAKDVLRQIACPILIAPEQKLPPKEIIFTSNGTASSIFSIKQLTYLFPEWHHLPVTVVQVSKSGMGDTAEQRLLTEWLSQYYQQLSFETVRGDAGMRLFEQLTSRRGSVLVMGAFGRTALSRLFKRSHADQLLRMLRQPVFITNYEMADEPAGEVPAGV